MTLGRLRQVMMCLCWIQKILQMNFELSVKSVIIGRLVELQSLWLLSYSFGLRVDWSQDKGTAVAVIVFVVFDN